MAVSYTLSGHAVEIFPNATSVSAYPASSGTGEGSNAPLGDATETQTMSAGSLTFTTLDPDTEYVAAGRVNTVWKFYRFTTASVVNKLKYTSESGSPAMADLSDFALGLLDDSDAATARATLGADEAGVELGYASITTDATNNSTTPADVSGLTVTVTTATRPIVVVFDCNSVNNGNANGGVRIDILQDGVVIGRASSLVNSASASWPVHREIRRSPAAGSHTFKIQLATLAAGTATIKADDGTAIGPAYITVREV